MPRPHLNIDVRLEPGAVAVVSIVHGAGDHGGRYAGLRQALSRANFATATVDLRGHGRSEGARLDVKRFEEYADDFETLRAVVDERRRGIPHFLLGHSMGALVALQSAVRKPDGVAGLILMSAVVRPARPLSRFASKYAGFVRPLAPKLRLPLGFSPDDLSRDPASREEARNDELMRRSATLRWGAELRKAMTSAMDQIGRLTEPLLILHGADDAIADIDAARLLFERAPAADKTFREYPEAMHELFAEVATIRSAVFGDLVTWLGAHSGSP